ncbi:MAG TPA: 6-hydroxymethylpterin diphosphokinase MptE-like protein [Nitrososphaeraceae archaeon]
MQFIDWFPYYQEIREEFGYSTEKDQNAAYLLSKLIKKKSLNLKKLEKKIKGKDVFVIGAGPSLEDDINFIKKNKRHVRVVSDGAVEALITNKIKPDVVVSDLDGNPTFLKKAEKLGAIMVIHAHGDNEKAIEKLVPKFKSVIGTTQVMPVENVYNFGGFTDGDRCVFMAEEMGAKSIVLVGMDLTDQNTRYPKGSKVDKNLKIKKLRRAKILLELLAKRSNSLLFNRSKIGIRGYTKVDTKNSKESKT